MWLVALVEGGRKVTPVEAMSFNMVDVIYLKFPWCFILAHRC